MSQPASSETDPLESLPMLEEWGPPKIVLDPKKPFWEQWWVWLIAMIVIAAIIGASLIYRTGAFDPEPETPQSPETVVAQTYLTAEELKDAAVLAGYYCQDWQIGKKYGPGEEFGYCSELDSFDVFSQAESVQNAIDQLKVMYASQGLTMLSGPNWIINLPNAATVRRLQRQLGGLPVLIDPVPARGMHEYCTDIKSNLTDLVCDEKNKNNCDTLADQLARIIKRGIPTDVYQLPGAVYYGLLDQTNDPCPYHKFSDKACQMWMKEYGSGTGMLIGFCQNIK